MIDICIIRAFSGCSCTTECLSLDLPIQKRLIDLNNQRQTEHNKSVDSLYAYGIGSTLLAGVLCIIAFWAVPKAIEFYHDRHLDQQEASVSWR